MTTTSRTITVQIVVEEDATNPQNFTVGFVQANGIDLRPDHDGGIDRVWYIRDNPTGLPILLLKYRPGLIDDDLPQTPDPDYKIVWEGSTNRYEATVNNERVVATLQSRPVSPGDWQDRWVWDGETLTCGDRHFATINEAIEDAENAYEGLKSLTTPTPLQKTWRWVAASELVVNDHVRDLSPGAGYDGHVHKVYPSGSSMCAIIGWHKWETEVLIDYKFGHARIEVERDTPIPDLTALEMFDIATYLGIEAIRPVEGETALHCRFNSELAYNQALTALLKYNLTGITTETDGPHVYVVVGNIIDSLLP